MSNNMVKSYKKNLIQNKQINKLNVKFSNLKKLISRLLLEPYVEKIQLTKKLCITK